jgi:hypothetical protein
MTNQGDGGLYASIASPCTPAREDVFHGLVKEFFSILMYSPVKYWWYSTEIGEEEIEFRIGQT